MNLSTQGEHATSTLSHTERTEGGVRRWRPVALHLLLARAAIPFLTGLQASD